MSFVSLGDGSTRPTFFELVAAERLLPSLKSAVLYSLRVFVQQRPSLYALLRRGDEAFALVNLLLDRSSLYNSSATFAETLYGLRRVQQDTPGQSSSKPADLSRASQRRTLILQVALPYLFCKCNALFSHHRPQIEAPLGLTARRSLPADTPPPQGGSSSRAAASLAWLRRQALRLFLFGYPWLHAAWEGLRFGFQLLYLLDSSAFYSPELWLLGQSVVRVSGTELMEGERRKGQARQKQLQRTPSKPALLQLLQRGWLRATWAVADHTRNALILSVFGFKLLEWWYNSAEGRIAGQQKKPPPPPPNPPLPVVDGIDLPSDPGICGLCQRPRTNPAMLSISGYLFCYPCLHAHLVEHSHCPVTHISATQDDVWRLYKGE
ncbi:hypothetical protein WJX84_006575 [Apatococcus fuscideae]|uniref:Peroxisome biogenesis protein 12 n=1 Tax=Apatococcus fuscideae TaxID=2026836 RepID=A0AAW1TFP8_9CHLO